MKYIITILLVSLVLISGCAKTECDKLALRFDRFVERGCYDISNKNYKDPFDTIVGATLIEISEPKFVNFTAYPYTGHDDEYHYSLTFKGKDKEYTFKAWIPASIYEGEIYYQVGDFYKFDFLRVCGALTSAGPHNKMYRDFDFDVLKPLVC